MLRTQDSSPAFAAKQTAACKVNGELVIAEAIGQILGAAERRAARCQAAREPRQIDSLSDQIETSTPCLARRHLRESPA